MLPHQQRVIDEKKTLDANATKLGAFIASNPTFKNLDVEEQDRLKLQSYLMGQLSAVLGQRIAAFPA
jgi:hypothetical protein